MAVKQWITACCFQFLYLVSWKRIYLYAEHTRSKLQIIYNYNYYTCLLTQKFAAKTIRFDFIFGDLVILKDDTIKKPILDININKKIVYLSHLYILPIANNRFSRTFIGNLITFTWHKMRYLSIFYRNAPTQ